YTSNNDWSTSIIPLDQYQEKLQERRREWEASQPVQPEDRREIDRLTRVLQERERELEEERREKEQVRNRLQQQLQGRERQLQQAQQQGQERERQAREREQDLQRLLQEKERQIQEAQQLQSRERESQEREQQLQRQVEGGQQREQDLQRQLQEREQQLEEREREGYPIILTELMPTSLRKELESGGVAYPAILSISLDVACALNYLHLFKPHPILHRDVSSANVLLQSIGNCWRAKVSDYGTVSLQPLTKTSNPGNPVYSAPESPYPNQHSPAMDVFSYGVLLIEMVVCEFPDVGKRVAQIKAIKRPTLKNLIERCLIENYKDRPTMSDIIKELNESI
uniref:Protein kinase domain-containing protein n=2 Tax=Amphimedon queenslandica TaxID=400682 RepID=A0A1X7TP01_AMPQE